MIGTVHSSGSGAASNMLEILRVVIKHGGMRFELPTGVDFLIIAKYALSAL